MNCRNNFIKNYNLYKIIQLKQHNTIIMLNVIHKKCPNKN